VHVVREQTICLTHDPGVLIEPTEERTSPPLPVPGEREACRKHLGPLLETLAAEELGAKRRIDGARPAAIPEALK
jgi:hypothetical protein